MRRMGGQHRWPLRRGPGQAATSHPGSPRSVWAASNKARVERLHPRWTDAPPRASPRSSERQGEWLVGRSLDSVERLEVPQDLAAALADRAPAAATASRASAVCAPDAARPGWRSPAVPRRGPRGSRGSPMPPRATSESSPEPTPHREPIAYDGGRDGRQGGDGTGGDAAPSPQGSVVAQARDRLLEELVLLVLLLVAGAGRDAEAGVVRDRLRRIGRVAGRAGLGLEGLRGRLGRVVLLARPRQHLDAGGDDLRLPVALPCASSQVRVAIRPSMATSWPLPRYLPHVSARRFHATTEWKSDSSLPPTYWWVAMENVATALPPAVVRSSGSRVRRPVSRTLFIGPWSPFRATIGGGRGWGAGPGGRATTGRRVGGAGDLDGQDER